MVTINRGFVLAAAVAAALLAGVLAGWSQPKPTLDFAFFVARVEPVFLEKRAGHARCYVCHVESNNAFRLVKLTPGAKAWNEGQSRENFAMTQLLVNPGDPATSRLLLHPLAPERGGDPYHSGGRQFSSNNDPAWKTLAAWINGAKLDAAKK